MIKSVVFEEHFWEHKNGALWGVPKSAFRECKGVLKWRALGECFQECKKERFQGRKMERCRDNDPSSTSSQFLLCKPISGSTLAHIDLV